MTKRRLRSEPIPRWTPAEIAQFTAQYPHMKTRLIAVMLGTDEKRCYNLAKRLGLEKSPEYLASPAACRLRRGDAVGAAFRFVKGQIPPNKGLRRPGWGPGRMKETQFRKGQKPHTWRPVGSVRLNGEGYREIKVDDTAKGPRAWVPFHRLNWIAAHGPIPKGMVLRFIDGNKLNTVAENLILITRRDHIRLNVHERYPKELRQITQLRGAITRQINKREGKHERKQDRGSSGGTVRNAAGPARQGKPDGDRAGEGRGRGRQGDRG